MKTDINNYERSSQAAEIRYLAEARARAVRWAEENRKELEESLKKGADITDIWELQYWLKSNQAYAATTKSQLRQLWREYLRQFGEAALEDLKKTFEDWGLELDWLEQGTPSDRETLSGSTTPAP